MIDILARCVTARKAKWKLGDSSVLTPNILFLEGHGYGAPSYSELELVLGDEPSLRSADGKVSVAAPIGLLPPRVHRRPLEEEDCGMPGTEAKGGPRASSIGEEIVVLDNAFEMRRDARQFVHAISDLRDSVGYERLVYTPGVMEPSNLALLTYLGADLFDASLVSYRAVQGVATLPEGNMLAQGVGWLPQKEEDLLGHNLQMAWRELLLVRRMIEVGRLRELVEARSNITPWGAAALRLFDLERYEHQERRAALVGPRFYANSKQSLSRPEIVRWRRRVLERWRPAPHKKVLLLIPCSAKKPYFISKSHQNFRETLLRVPNFEVVQELIVTSPLGVVPRELELFYPAAHYDIPVTGHWDLEEQRMIVELISSSLAKGFEKVVCHLGHGSDFVKDAMDCVDTSEGSASSGESLRRLEEKLAKLCYDFERPSRGTERAESLASVARFQFGAGGDALAEGCTVSGNYPYSKLFAGREQMGILTPERGMISLTMEGAMRLVPRRIHWVEMEDFDLSGNLFAVGIKEADPNLRTGDEVLVMRDAHLEAVGIAAMSGDEMSSMNRGEAVRVRHKRRPAKN